MAYMFLANKIENGEVFRRVHSLVSETLQLGERANDLLAETPLIGNLPELDSMAVLAVISALENDFHFEVADDDDMSEAFLTLDSLSRYVEQKLLL